MSQNSTESSPEKSANFIFIPSLEYLNTFSISYSKEKKGLQSSYKHKELNKSIPLSEFLKRKNDYSVKCELCHTNLNIYEGLKILEEEKYCCNECSKGTGDIFKLAEKEKDVEDKYIQKFSQIIEHSNSTKNLELYNFSLSEFHTFQNFTLCILYNLHLSAFSDKLSKRKEICTKCLDQIDYILKVILENKEFYDIYSCIKECFLFGGIEQTTLKILENKAIKGHFLSALIHKFIIKKFNLCLNNEFELKKLNGKIKIEEKIKKMKKTLNSFNLLNSSIEEIKRENEIIEIKVSQINLQYNYFLTQYFDSYFQNPGDLILKRKTVNSLLYEIIINKFDKIENIKPTKNMVSRIIYEIDHLLENKLLSDISKKLEIIKNYLITEYGNKQIIQEKEKKNYIILTLLLQKLKKNK